MNMKKKVETHLIVALKTGRFGCPAFRVGSRLRAVVVLAGAGGCWQVVAGSGGCWQPVVVMGGEQWCEL